MRIGIILTGYNMREYVDECLSSWIQVRTRHHKHSFVICAVSLPFSGFPNDEDDGTTELLQKYYDKAHIDNLIIEPKNISEIEARGMALNWLKDEDVDIVWQVDADEFYTAEDIERIIEFVEANQFITWFRLSLKNFVFNTNTYLEEPFTPARIHRIKSGKMEATHFSGDNDISYGSAHQNTFSNMTIPQSVAWIRHMTWLSNERSRKKVAYHEAHFAVHPNGLRCSYSWDEKLGLIFNQAYYTYIGQPIPKILFLDKDS